MNVPQVRRIFRLELIEPAGRFVQISLLALALVTLSLPEAHLSFNQLEST
jgi:hypothetical protein